MSEWAYRHYVAIMVVIVALAVLCFGVAIVGPILWPNLGASWN